MSLLDNAELKQMEPPAPTDIYHEHHPLHHLVVGELDLEEEAYNEWVEAGCPS